VRRFLHGGGCRWIGRRVQHPRPQWRRAGGDAIIFLCVKLGSVCTHCLYNSAVGWSNIVHCRVGVLTLCLGVVGMIVAAAGIWDYFIDWLNLLGVIVPPIGAIIIVDQLWARRHDRGPVPAVRWQPFVAWAIGSGIALLVDKQAPSLCTVAVGLVSAGIACAVLEKLTFREPPPGAPVSAAQPAVSEGVTQ
jgi:cytosine permease